MARLRVGLLVNPVAGLGGPGAYKGSDGNWQDALAEGYPPTAPERARRLVEEGGPGPPARGPPRRFVEECGPDLHWVTVTCAPLTSSPTRRSSSARRRARTP